MIRTHFSIAILAILLFLPQINNKIIFIFTALIATLLPDIDTAFSTLGKEKVFRFLQFFVRHRGFIHSFTFAIVISIIIAFFLPIVSLGFFLGYGIHLFADSFTREGIMPFWPYKGVSKWHIKTGGLVETSVFVVFLLLDLLVLIFMIAGFF